MTAAHEVSRETERPGGPNLAEPVAVVGLGCRFPGGVVDADSYWKLLDGGVDAVSEIPPDRWDADEYYAEEPRQPGKTDSRWGGFLDRIDRFDHEFFGISRREALAMDPQQRLTLEVAWEALENAGLDPSSLAGSQTGVFLGACNFESGSATVHHPEDVSAYTSSGMALSFIPGRISYLLDLRGPNMTIDTACSSSLVAVHQACLSLRTGESDLALAGGVNVVLSPLLMISQSQFGSVSRQGRAKTFSDMADGYVRGEGCGIVVLKRLSDALRDDDRILAVLRGGAVNQDGRSSGITAPNGAAQRSVLRRALRASGVAAEDVGYIEAHGTGTRLGDPIEVEALAEVYGRPDGPPVYLGAVKTNFGHLEAAAGIAGLIKVVLCLQRGAVPRNVHFTRLNPEISFDGTTFVVPTETTDWRTDGRPRVAGVSSFGLSGTNAHLILEQAPERAVPEADDRRPGSVLALSARSDNALAKLARRYADRLAADDDVALADLCFTANAGRAHLPHRLAVTGSTRDEVASLLREFVRGELGDGLYTGLADRSDVVFLYTGQGAQRTGTARTLYETQPTFRAAIDECAEILRPLLDVPLLDLLYPDDPESGLINETAYAQPATFAIEYAMTRLWQSWGVEPAAVLGHSLGECVAACVAGVMTLPDALAFVVRRGRLIQDLGKPGLMAAVSASEAEVLDEIADYPDRISIAAVNGAANTTISGDRELVEEICATFTERGVRAKPLHIASSGHSPLVQPVLGPLKDAVRDISFSTPKIPLASNVTGDLWPWDSAPDAEYWARHTRRPVQFAKCVRTLREAGYRIFLEVGPAPTLAGLISDDLAPGDDDLLVPSLRPKHDDWSVLLSTVARLYTRGVNLDWAGFDRDYRRSKVEAPTYAFDATRCWRELRHFAAGAAPSAPVTESQPEPEPVSTPVVTSAPVRTRGNGLPEIEKLRTLSREALEDELLTWSVRTVRSVLGAESSALDPDQRLIELGLDSLMAVELRNEIRSSLGVTVSVADFLRDATIRSVAASLAERFLAEAAGGDGADAAKDAPVIERVAPTSGDTDDLAAELLTQLDQLPEDEARALLDRES
ncbi:type I polyketide synthase [Saccharomonospora sp. NB11]|uniref:type I polyketide synthase n=1 Tax=Saccharomonospora sp. NB11 TaxID=1642298 RepID=UPI0018D1F50C|nr:type I polyketide synthase [Saccharomonospora sp. NB11]